MRLPTKEEVAARLMELPLLEKTALVLLYDRWFRAAVIVLGTFLLGVVVACVKVWTVTPPGFLPEVKVRAIDLLQARSLRHAAERQLMEGRYQDALTLWRLAVANNPGDLQLLRGFLEQLAIHGRPDRHQEAAVRNCAWLLRLTQTNLADLELCARVCQRAGLDEYALRLMAPHEEALGPAAAVAYAKAMLNARQTEGFERVWRRLERRGEVAQDPELALYQAAYQAGWAEGGSMVEGQAALDRAIEDPSSEVLAHRLQLLVSERRADLARYEATLEALQARHAARLSDHLAFWSLLQEWGQQDRVAELLRSNVCAPATPSETVRFARLLYRLESADKARQVFRRYAPEFPDSEEVWLSYSNLLVDQERWSDLRTLALSLRDGSNPARNAMMGFSYLLEGLAELRLGRERWADAAFRKILRSPMDRRLLCVKTATRLIALGHPEIAESALRDLRREAQGDPEYWLLVARSAYELRDAPLLSFAMAEAHALKPEDPEVAHNYAAALLSSRALSAETVRITFELLNQDPERAGYRLNHAAALAQNRRWSEARQCLEAVDPSRLTDDDANTARLAWLEVHLGEGAWDSARRVAARIDRSRLFWPELQWLDQAERAIRAGVAGRSVAPP